MRKVLFLMLSIMAFAFTNDVTGQAPLLYTGFMGPDTVTNTATVTHYPNGTSFATARRFKDLGALEVVCRLDSLTGATNATATLQYAYDLAGTVWYDAATTSLNTGSNTLGRFFRTEDTELSATWWRVVYTGIGTMTAKVQTVYAFKRRL